MNALNDLMVIGRVGASLLVVVVLAVLAARLARKASLRGPGAGLRVVDRVGLTREAAVAVVQVAGKALVVGITAREVTLLSELDGDDLERMAIEPGPEPASTWPQDGERVPGRRASQRIGSGSRGSGSVLDPRTWKQGVDALRDLTVRR